LDHPTGLLVKQGREPLDGLGGSCHVALPIKYCKFRPLPGLTAIHYHVLDDFTNADLLAVNLFSY
jgi:hypothetical protein